MWLSAPVVNAGSRDKIGLDVLTYQCDVIGVGGVVVELLQILTVSDEGEVVLLRGVGIDLNAQVHQLLDGVG